MPHGEDSHCVTRCAESGTPGCVRHSSSVDATYVVGRVHSLSWRFGEAAMGRPGHRQVRSAGVSRHSNSDDGATSRPPLYAISSPQRCSHDWKAIVLEPSLIGRVLSRRMLRRTISLAY
jgi:hypothetical protein